MKAITREWLDRAGDDLRAAELLLSQASLTNMVAFHAQQVVEKSFKAILEEYGETLVRTHSLTRLYKLIQPFYDFVPAEEMDMLDRLETVYTEARYPNELGLLPSGKPTSTQAYDLLAFARQLHEVIVALLQENSEDKIE